MSPLLKFTLFIGFLVVLSLPAWALAQTGDPTSTPSPSATPTYFPFPTLDPNASATGQDEVDGVIHYGETIEGSFTSFPPPAVYRFVGHAGDVVSVRMTSSLYDVNMAVQDSAGNYIQTTYPGQNGSMGYENLILPFTLPADGTYAIQINNPSGSPGSYIVTLRNPPLPTVPFNQPVTGSLSPDEPLQFYCFTGKAGDIVSVGLNSGDFNAFLTLSPFGINDGTIRSDDNSGGNTNALIGPFSLPVDGVYLVVVRSNDGVTTGNYSLLLDRVEMQTISYGETVQADFTPETQSLYYRFDGLNGEIVDIHVDSHGTVDTQLTLVDASIYALTSDDDSANGYDPELLNIMLGQTGAYFIKLNRYDAQGAGRVSLSLTLKPPPSLEDGPQEVILNAKHMQSDLVFQGVAGEQVRLKAEINGDYAPSISVFQNSQLIASFSTADLTVFSGEFLIAEDGEVHVQVSSFAGLPMVLSLSLEHLGLP